MRMSHQAKQELKVLGFFLVLVCVLGTCVHFCGK